MQNVLDKSRIVRIQKFTLSVGDGRSAEQLLAAGKFDTVGEYPRAFIASGSFRIAAEPAKIELELLELDFDPTTAEALAEIQEPGVDEVTEEHALRFAEKYPEQMMEGRPIPFLHTANTWRSEFSGHNILVISKGQTSGRMLRCHRLDVGWGRQCRFARRCR